MPYAVLLALLALVLLGGIGSCWSLAAAARIEREAASRWAAAALIAGAALLARLALPAGLASALGMLGACVATVAARRGARAFGIAGQDDRREVGVLAAVASAAAVLAATGSRPGWLDAAGLAAAAGLTGHSTLESWRRLRFEFGAKAALAIAGGEALAAGLFGIAALAAPWWPAPDRGFETVGLVLSASLALHASFAARSMARLREALQHLSLQDPLTGVLNRRGLQARWDAESRRLARYGTTYAFLAVEIEGLERVRERLGEEAAEAALHSVARAMQAALREVDGLGRSGGTGASFRALLPQADEAAARGAANRLLACARQQLGSAADPSAPRVSVAYAVASDRRESRDELMRRLDAARARALAEGSGGIGAAPEPTSALRLAAD